MDWNELRDRLSALPALEQRSEQLLGQVWETKSHVDSLLAVYERERINTQRIKENTLSASLLKLTGRYENRLAKEERDEIHAKLEYDQAVNRLSYLRGEQEELAQRIKFLKAEEAAYKDELAKKRSDLAGAEFAALDKEHDEIIMQLTAAKEALMTASRVNATAKKALKCMTNANKWANVDNTTAMGSGMITHIAKYDHLDAAETHFNTLSSQVSELLTELKVIKDLKMPDISGIKQISTSAEAADFWYEHVFEDFSSRKKLGSDSDDVQTIIKCIEAVESVLELKLNELNKALEANRKEEEKLLLK